MKTRYASTAFDGEGARRYGARWNSPGVRVAYASSNSALAVLEVLVHLKDVTILPSYSLVAASLPDDAIEQLDAAQLPDGWNEWPAPPAVQAIGNEWIRHARSLALRVPSALVPDASNVLINPAHADVVRFTVDAVVPFSFDERLLH